MRLLLLPISTRRVLVYCEPLSQTIPNAQKTYIERIVTKANETWASWETAESGWKRKTTQYGNMMFRRIPFEEWGLKSIPPRKRDVLQSGESKTVQTSIAANNNRVEVRYPKLYQDLTCGKETVLQTLQRLSVERQDLHKSRMIYSVLGMPLTAPAALIPILPNLPFFYLVFRAWSHWRALTGSRHLQYLLSNKLINPSPSSTLDSLYTAGLLHDTQEESRRAARPTAQQTEQVVNLIRKQIESGSPGISSSASVASTKAGGEPEVNTKSSATGEELMLLRKWNGKLIAERLQLPALEVEIERAVEQVEQSLQREKRAPTSGNDSSSSSQSAIGHQENTNKEK